MVNYVNYIYNIKASWFKYQSIFKCGSNNLLVLIDKYTLIQIINIGSTIESIPTKEASFFNNKFMLCITNSSLIVPTNIIDHQSHIYSPYSIRSELLEKKSCSSQLELFGQMIEIFFVKWSFQILNFQSLYLKQFIFRVK